MEKIERIDKGIEAVRSPYILCSLLAKRGKQLMRRFPATERSFGTAVQKALDEVIRGELDYECPAEIRLCSTQEETATSNGTPDKRRTRPVRTAPIGSVI